MVRDVRPGFSRPSEMSAPAWAWNVGGPLGKPLDSISSVAMQGYSGRPGRQGGRDSGMDRQLDQPTCFASSPLPGRAGGRYRENYLQSLAGPDLENESKILVSNIRIRSTATTILVLDIRTCVPGASHDAAACCLTLFCFLIFFRWGELQTTSPRRRSSVGVHVLCSLISCSSE